MQITIDDLTHGTDDTFNFCVRNFGAFSERNWKTFDLEAKGLKIIAVATIGEPHEFLAAMLPSAGKIFPINVSSVGYERSPLVLASRQRSSSLRDCDWRFAARFFVCLESKHHH